MLFDGLDWYQSLPAPENGGSYVWYVVKGPLDDLWARLLNAALRFAADHDLIEVYRKKFAGVSLSDFQPSRAKKERRSQAFPIWRIANELLVARYLERVLNWKFTTHEPKGAADFVGDWQFAAPSGKAVFVEVESPGEPDPAPSSGAYSEAIPTGRVQRLLKEAYRQLPDDDRATFVVLVGGRTLWTAPYAPLIGAVPSALFGSYGVTVRVLPYDPNSVREGPSFHNMFVHADKNRGLGCVGALRPAGLDDPTLAFYAIHNPSARQGAILDAADLGVVWQFVVNASGEGRFVGEDDPDEAWRRVDSND